MKALPSFETLETIHQKTQYYVSIVRKTNEMHFLYSVYYKLTASTCFENSNPGSSQQT
jgi:hypothetical protein